MVKEVMNEAQREVGGYYMMKQLKDLAHDAKRSGEKKVAKALMFLHDRINQSSRDIDLNADDLNDFLKDPRGRKYGKDLPDWMIDSLFESDLPTTTKKDKTVTVVHKTSGKELVVTDTPSTRKKYKRMGYFVQADPRKIKKAIGIAKKMSGNMTGAIKKIEKIEKDLSNNHEVAYALKAANESINEGNPTSAVQKKLIKIFQNDPLYKDVIMATNSKDFKKAIDTLRSIRGPNAIALLKKHSKKLMGKDY